MQGRRGPDSTMEWAVRTTGDSDLAGHRLADTRVTLSLAAGAPTAPRSRSPPVRRVGGAATGAEGPSPVVAASPSRRSPDGRRAVKARSVARVGGGVGRRAGVAAAAAVPHDDFSDTSSVDTE